MPIPLLALLWLMVAAILLRWVAAAWRPERALQPTYEAEVARLREEVDQLTAQVARLTEEQQFLTRLLTEGGPAPDAGRLPQPPQPENP